MVQFKSHRSQASKVSGGGLDATARAAVARALHSLGEAVREPDAVVRTEAGHPVFVVVVERVRDEFPSTGQVEEHLGLTPREAQVAIRLAKRLTSQEIANELDVTVHTARRHTERLLEKMGVGNRMDVRGALLALAQRLAQQEADERSYEAARQSRRLAAVAA